jgi:hypothetical protein
MLSAALSALEWKGMRVFSLDRNRPAPGPPSKNRVNPISVTNLGPEISVLDAGGAWEIAEVY